MNYQQRRHPYAVPTGRYSSVAGLRGLADGNFNLSKYLIGPVPTAELDLAKQAALAVADNKTNMIVGFWENVPLAKVVAVGTAYFAVVRQNELAASGITTQPTYISAIMIGKPIGSDASFAVWRLNPKNIAIGGATGGASTGTVSTTDCPPPENCQERLVNKTVYVSARPVDGAIEIPVAYKKYICEGDSVQPPEIDCDELLNALKQAVSSGDVPGMTMQGLGLLPSIPTGDISIGSTTTTQPSGPEQSYAPDWCKDCREVMVKATAYVTDKQVEGAVPFNVKMKVLVCETSPDPTIDCDQVVQALQAGFKAKKWSALNGLSSPRYPRRRGLAEAVTTTGTKKATSSRIMPGEPDFSFDAEAARLAPIDSGSSFPWWAVAIAAAGGLYFLTK